MMDQEYFPNIALQDLPEEVVYAGVPLISSLIAIFFKVSSLSVVRYLVLSLFVSSLLLVIRRIRTDWREGKLAGLIVASGFLGWYAIPAFINFFSQENPYIGILPVSIHHETTIWAVIYLSLFLVTWVLASHFFARVRFFRPAFSIVSFETNPLRLTWIGIACCSAGFIPYIFSGMGISEVISLIFQSRLVEKPWLHWENLGDFRSPFLFISHSAMAAGACILWLTTREKKFKLSRRILIGMFVLIVSMVIFFDQGTRSTVALVVLPVLLMKCFEDWKKNKVRFFVSASAFGVLFLVLLQLQLSFRVSGTSSGLPQPVLLKWVTLEDTTDMFSETVFSLNLVPMLHDYFKESVLVQFLVSPIPRFIWPSKPASQVVWYYTLHRWGIDIYEGGGNVFPGVVGHSYMSWGGWGPIFLGGFMGWLSSRVDGFLIRTSRISAPYYRAVGVMMSVWILLSFRVLSPGFLYPVGMVFVMVRLSSTERSDVRPRYMSPYRSTS